MTIQTDSFFSETFMPHGYCLQWRSDILWLNVISDLFIATAYFSIPIVLILFVRKRKDIQFRGVFFLFAAFILCCGITHLMSIYNMWHGAYGLHGIMKAITAIVSVVTAYVAFNNLEKATSIPSRTELESALKLAAHETIKAKKLEIEQKSQEIFKFTTELLPSGLLVINEKQIIVMANAALCDIFGYEREELVNQPLSILLDSEIRHHSILVEQYIKKPEQSHQMAAGRVVRGVHKDGHLVDIQINLSVHVFADEKHTFATVTDFGSFFFEQEQKNELSNRLHRAIDASEDGIWEWNIPNHKVWYSPRFMTLIGKEHKEHAELDDWLEHIHPEDMPKINEALDSHFLEKTRFDINYRGRTASGQYEWFRTRGDSIFDQNGQAILMSGLLSNINETKRLENQLAEKSRFLNEVLQRSLTGLYIYELEKQKITFINPEYTNLTGYTFETLGALQKNNKYNDLFHPNDQAHIHAHQTSLLKYGSDEGQGIEFRFKHHSGVWKWLYLRESVYSYSQDGSPKELLGAFFDISELKHREYEIRKLALDYFTTFEQAGVGIAHVNLDGSFIKANAKFLEIFNYKDLGEITDTFTSLCDEVDREKLFVLIKQLLKSKTPIFNVEKKFLRSNREIFWADLTVSHIKPLNTDVSAYFIVVLQDISERKLMEQNLSESNLALERFAYSASHDLQEPLRKISAFSGALERRLRELTEDPEILFQLDRICDASVRMGKMIDNLLKLSRANSEALVLTECSLSALVVQTLDDLNQKTHDLDIKLFLRNDLTLFVDLNAFGQVIRNLIINSIAYRGKEKALIIEMTATTNEKLISITYKDNGIGISDDKLEEIFEPFSRLVSKVIPGTGMGLTICKQIIKAHKGRIYAAIDQDPGATFIIELPNLIGTSD